MAGPVLQHPPTYAMTHRPGHVDVLPQCETPEEFIVRTSPRLRVFQHDYVSDDVFESPITTESALASHVQETSDAFVTRRRKLGIICCDPSRYTRYDSLS